MSELVLSELNDRVMTIRLNRADKKNALTGAMYTGIAEALRKAAADSAVRSVVLTGSGGVFCAGNDLQDFLKLPPSSQNSPVMDFMYTLSSFAKPIVAAIYGPAIGVGATLLLHVDLAYAGASTKLQFPFVNLGICAEFASSLLLPRLAGHAKASELLLLGEFFDAQTAKDIGLVNAVLPDDEVEARAMAAAQKLALQPPQALRKTKALMRGWDAEQLKTVIAIEAENFMRMLGEAEARESLSAFVQKRKPDFSKFV